MMNKVYGITRNYDVIEEDYADDVEALNRTKVLSLRCNFAIIKNRNGKVFFYEHGELTNIARKQKLAKEAEDILVSRIEKEVKIARGRRHVKKQ